jgi:hypothetical protein
MTIAGRLLAEHGVGEVGLLVDLGVSVVGVEVGCRSKSTRMILPVNWATGP